MPDPKVVISEFMDEGAVSRLAERFETLYDPALVDQPEELAQALDGAQALIVRNRTQVRGDLLAAGGALQAVGRLGVGLDNIDLEACAARGIDVYPATGANDASVAEYVLTAALMLRRGAWLRSSDVAAGDWPRQAMMGAELGGVTFGLLGFGSIAREVAARAEPFGVNLIAHDPFLAEDDPAWGGVQPVSQDALFGRSDVLSLHVPLTDSTRHVVDGEALAAMPRGGIVINAARGGVVDEAALCAALRSGYLGGAALDVFEHEPLDSTAGAAFKGLNVLLTPHIAGVTEESNVRVSHLVADKILAKLG
ncbi:MAG: hydroxyacid dehydrogenase [Pseudomonadota bacterium]